MKKLYILTVLIFCLSTVAMADDGLVQREIDYGFELGIQSSSLSNSYKLSTVVGPFGSERNVHDETRIGFNIGAFAVFPLGNHQTPNAEGTGWRLREFSIETSIFSLKRGGNFKNSLTNHITNVEINTWELAALVKQRYFYHGDPSGFRFEWNNFLGPALALGSSSNVANSRGTGFDLIIGGEVAMYDIESPHLGKWYFRIRFVLPVTGLLKDMDVSSGTDAKPVIADIESGKAPESAGFSGQSVLFTMGWSF